MTGLTRWHDGVRTRGLLPPQRGVAQNHFMSLANQPHHGMACMRCIDRMWYHNVMWFHWRKPKGGTAAFRNRPIWPAIYRPIWPGIYYSAPLKLNMALVYILTDQNCGYLYRGVTQHYIYSEVGARIWHYINFGSTQLSVQFQAHIKVRDNIHCVVNYYDTPSQFGIQISGIFHCGTSHSVIYPHIGAQGCDYINADVGQSRRNSQFGTQVFVNAHPAADYFIMPCQDHAQLPCPTVQCAIECHAYHLGYPINLQSLSVWRFYFILCHLPSSIYPCSTNALLEEADSGWSLNTVVATTAMLPTKECIISVQETMLLKEAHSSYLFNVEAPHVHHETRGGAGGTIAASCRHAHCTGAMSRIITPCAQVTSVLCYHTRQSALRAIIMPTDRVLRCGCHLMPQSGSCAIIAVCARVHYPSRSHVPTAAPRAVFTPRICAFLSVNHRKLQAAPCVIVTPHSRSLRASCDAMSATLSEEACSSCAFNVTWVQGGAVIATCTVCFLPCVLRYPCVESFTDMRYGTCRAIRPCGHVCRSVCSLPHVLSYPRVESYTAPSHTSIGVTGHHHTGRVRVSIISVTGCYRAVRSYASHCAPSHGATATLCARGIVLRTVRLLMAPSPRHVIIVHCYVSSVPCVRRYPRVESCTAPSHTSSASRAVIVPCTIVPCTIVPCTIVPCTCADQSLASRAVIVPCTCACQPSHHRALGRFAPCAIVTQHSCASIPCAHAGKLQSSQCALATPCPHVFSSRRGTTCPHRICRVN